MGRILHVLFRRRGFLFRPFDMARRRAILPRMPNIDKLANGSFCWLELGTTDQNSAKNFYGKLFGWQYHDSPMGPNDFYTMFQLQGRSVGAAYTLSAEMRAQKIPAHWMVYMLVASADATAAKAAQLGGKVLKPAFDVYDVGRMTVIEDPTGAHFCAWQAKSHSGFGIAGEEGTFCWGDLSTPNRARAAEFYSGLFGWQIMKEDEEDSHNYWHLKNGEEFIGGMPPEKFRDPNSPPSWLSYILVNDCDASAATAKELGAKFYMPPSTFEDVGRMAVLADPQGAVFAIFQPTRRK